MTFRYSGTGFYINVKPGEIVGDTIKRLLAEQPNAARPGTSQLRAQVKFVHAIEDMRVVQDIEAMREILVSVMTDLAREIHDLTPE